MEEQAYQQRVMELQRLNRALRFLSSVNQVLLHATTEAELLQQACQIAVEVGEYRMAWVGLAEYDAACSVRPICHAGHEDGYLTAVPISWSDHEAGHEPTGTAIRTGQPEMQPDIAYAPEQAPWREAALTRGYRSVIALPVFIDTHVIGAFTLFGDTTQAFTAEDIQLLMALASDLGYGITALRTREQQRQAVDELRDSEEKYRRLHESMTDAFVRVDMTGRIVESNLAYQQMLGSPAEELAHLH